MQKKCGSCGDVFEAKRPAAKFCSDRCRKRSHRAPKPAAKVVAIVPPVVDEPATRRPVMPSSYEATLAQLEAAGRLDTALGVSALIAAQMLDDALRSADTGASRAALLKAHREALAEAVKDSKAAADPLDQIRAAAALKLVSGGRS